MSATPIPLHATMSNPCVPLSLPPSMVLLYNMTLYKKVKKNSITEQDTEQTHQTPKFHLTQLDKQMLAT